MVTIDGLAMAGLGPPGLTPSVAHGNAGPVDFASVLATADGRSRGLPSQGLPRAAVPALVGALVDQTPIPLGEPEGGEPGQAVRTSLIEVVAGVNGLVDGVAMSAAAAKGDSTGPDRASEATIETDSTDEGSLLAASVAVQGTLTTPPVSPAPVLIVRDPSVEPSPIQGAVRPLGVDAEGADPTDVDEPASTGAGTPKGPDGVLEGIEPGKRGEVASAAHRPEHAGTPGETEHGGQPEDRLGAVIRDLPVEERSATARAWNRAGGRFQVETPPQDAVTPVESGTAGDVVTPTVDASGATANVSGSETGDAGASSTGDGDPASTTAPDLDGPRAGEATDGAVTSAARAVDGQPQVVEAPRDAVATAGAPVDASDPSVLRARLTDSVYEAAGNGDETIRLVLSPPELGHLDIRVERTDGGVRVDVTAATAEAADLIQQALPALVSGLEARSLRVDSAEVRHASTSGDPSNSRGADAGARQSGERGTDGDPQWARPDWSEAARLGRPAARAADRGRAATGLLDLVA